MVDAGRALAARLAAAVVLGRLVVALAVAVGLVVLAELRRAVVADAALLVTLLGLFARGVCAQTALDETDSTTTSDTATLDMRAAKRGEDQITGI